MLLEPAPLVVKLPALLNVPVVPPFRMMPFPLALTSVQVDPARLLMTAPFCRNSTLVEAKAVAPETLSVRVSRNGWPEGMFIPPLALVTPVPLMVPPVQVKRPVRVITPAPLRVPALKFVAPCTVLAPFRLRVPPVMLRALAKVAAPVTVSGPLVKAIVALLVRLAMVWLAVARAAMVMVEPEKAVPIQAVSVAMGTAPLLQLPGVPHWLSPAEPVH